MATNLVLQLQVIEPDADLNSIMIGNSYFNDDVWDLSPFIHGKAISKCRTFINFSFIAHDMVKDVVKRYAYYRLGKVKPLTVNSDINNKFITVYEFMSQNAIYDFYDMTYIDFLNFSIWLKEVKNVETGTGYLYSHLLEDIIKVGQIKGWRVPSFHIRKSENSSHIWNTKQSMASNKTKPIPENIFNEILYRAVHDEKNLIIKSFIIIQSQTGLRISEVLSIEEGCIKATADGYCYLELELSKTVKDEPILHKVFVNQLVVDTVKSLSEYTHDIRRKSHSKKIFINNTTKKLVTRERIDHMLKQFIRRWDIRNEKGEFYPLASHQFRATFVRELIKRKVPIAMIMKQYSHVSIEMTAHYLTLQEEEVKEIYSDMILSPESKIAGLRAKEIKGKLDDLFHGKTEAEIDDVITDLSKTMSFNPLPTGVCLYDFRRGNCTDGDGCFFYNCPNYITEVQFYPILKDELDLLEKEMARLKELGHEREWQKQYIKYKYLKPLVESLEVQLNGKESVG